MKNIRTKKLYGIGINDADYVVKIQESYYVEGKRHRKTTWECPYYVKMEGNFITMLFRTTYRKKTHLRFMFYLQGMVDIQ